MTGIQRGVCVFILAMPAARSAAAQDFSPLLALAGTPSNVAITGGIGFPYGGVVSLDVDVGTDILMSADLGTHAWSLGVGIGGLDGMIYKSRGGGAVNLAVVHTHSDIQGLPSGQTYVGLEARVLWESFAFGMGALGLVDGDRNERRFIMSASVRCGWMF